MKWYYWVLIVAVIAIIGFVWWKNKNKMNSPAEGSECTVNEKSTRNVAPSTYLPISVTPVKGKIINGVCVKN